MAATVSAAIRSPDTWMAASGQPLMHRWHASHRQPHRGSRLARPTPRMRIVAAGHARSHHPHEVHRPSAT